MNQITIAGHLGADPEVRFTSSGQKVTTLRVAAKVRRGGKDETIWYKITVWGEQFDKIIPFFKKGSSIIVVGELSKPEIFTDREGRPQVSMNITAFNLMFSPFGRPDSPADSGESAHAPQSQQSQQMEHSHGASSTQASSPQQMDYAHAAPAATGYGQGKVNPAFSEDEIPF